jgi:hypothetical protein
MIPGTDNRHKRKPIDNGSTTTSKKACNTRDDIDTEIVRKNLDFKRWLMTLVRSASLTESEENDIGTLGFLVKNIYILRALHWAAEAHGRKLNED